MSENFLELFNEFAAENSAEFTQLFAEIAGELAYRRKVSMEERDRFLTDFRVAWGGMKEQDGSVLDAGPPPEQVQRYHEINGKESNYAGQKHQKDYNAVAGGVSIHGGTHSIDCFQGRGNIVLGSKADALAYLQELVNAISQMEDDPDAPSSEVSKRASSPANQNAKVAYGNPTLKARMERNLRELEKFAEQSAFNYPRWS